jgi:hypothetical protein
VSALQIKGIILLLSTTSGKLTLYQLLYLKLPIKQCSGARA